MASAFALEPGEHVDAEARRLAKEGAAHVLAAIEGAAHENQNERLVHDARRTLKRLRALLRLVSADRAAAHLLRDAARPLGSVRDASVMVRTFDQIADGDAGAPHTRALLARARKTAQKKGDGRDESAARVKEFIDTIDSWKLDSGWDAIAPGIRRSYRDGRRALRRARDKNDPESLHELRKRAKDLQYQLALLRNVWPPVIKGYGEAVKELGQLLGDDHDLAVLDAELAKRGVEADTWHARIEERRKELHKRIFPMAERVYLEPTKVFVERFGSWWRASQLEN